MPGQIQPIGVISSDLGGYYFGAMLSGIHQVARKAGIPLIVIQGALREHHLPLLCSEHVAGWIILHPIDEDQANLVALRAAGKPVITVPVGLPGVDCTLVQVDNRGGMRAAVAHLIEHGHRRIAYIDHGSHTWSQQRRLGYCDALEEHGIAVDPGLVIQIEHMTADGAEIHVQRGEHAARFLLEQGLPCTALACSTDTSALTAMRILQAAGRRIPDDLAIVGFDDIVEAQYASSPLTSVRCQFDAIGVAAAEQLLGAIGTGRSAEAQVISVETTVLCRRSCGCTSLDQRLIETAAPLSASAGWQAALERRLVEIIRYPLPLAPTTPPAQLWPGANMLVEALDAALQGQQPPAAANLADTWHQAIAQTENLEVLHTALTLIEDTAEQQLAAAPAASARPAVMTLLRQMRLEMMRARLAYEAAPKQLLGDQVRVNYAVSMALLGGSIGEAQSLNWLANTPATWGCLALWDNQNGARATDLTIAGTYRHDSATTGRIGQHLRATAFPPLDWMPISTRQGQDLTLLFPIRTKSHDWGVLALCGWSDQPLTTGNENLTIQATLLGVTLDRDAVLSALTEQQATLQAAYSRERMLSQTIRELGCPIIPLLPSVLLVPLIGALDSQRAQQIIGAVLTAIGEQQAQTVLLDVTGVPIVDTQVASSLIQTAHAAMLLGARVIMVGIRPEIAQSIVGLGIDLRHLTIYSTLASAISRLQLQRPAR